MTHRRPSGPRPGHVRTWDRAACHTNEAFEGLCAVCVRLLHGFSGGSVGYSGVLRPAGAGSPGTVLRLNRLVSVECFGHLALRLLGRHAGFLHDVTALTHQALVDRQVVVPG